MISNGRLWALATAAGCAAFYFFAFYAQHRFSGGFVEFLNHGDNRQAWLPQFMTGYDRFWHGGLFSTDLFTVGGSGVFGLRSNLPVLYPPLIVSYLFFDVSKIETAVVIICLILVAHVFVASYATFRIVRSLQLPIAFAVFAAVSYVTSLTMIRCLDFFPFFFQAMMLPVVVRALLKIVDGDKNALVLAVPVVVFFALTGYPPMMLFGVVTALWLTAILTEHPLGVVARRLAAAFPLVAPALPFVVIYYYGQLKYFAQTTSASAVFPTMPGHDAPYAPMSLAGTLVGSMGNDEIEVRIYIGVFALLTIVSALVIGGRSARWHSLNKSLIAFYTFFVLLSFGRANWLSDLFYNVPVFGMMHVYQRFVIFSILPFVIAFAISLATVREKLAASQYLLQWKVAGGVILTLCLIAASIFGRSSNAAIGFEILWLGLAAFALVVVENDLRFALICASCLSFSLVTVGALFPRPHGERVMAAVIFDKKNRQTLQDHLFSGDRKLVRVLDLTSDASGGFPKNTGWIFKSGDRRVFNFLGYELHLNASADYLNMMGGWFGMYNVEYVETTGVDHVVWKNDEPDKLKSFLGLGYEIENTIPLGEQLRISKVRKATRTPSTPAADGDRRRGVQILDLSEGVPKWMQPGWGHGWAIEGDHYVKAEPKQSNFGVPVRTIAGKTYELELTADPAGDALAVWLGGHECGVFRDAGRKTCSVVSDGVNDLWFDSSGAGHSTITSIAVRHIHAQGVDPTIFADGLVEVRGKNGEAQSQTDWARTIDIEADLPSGGRAYLNIWPLKHLRYYLDDKRIEASLDDVGRPSIDLPPGKSSVRVKLWSPFSAYLLYALIVAALGWVLLATQVFWRPILARRRRIVAEPPAQVG